VIDERYEQVRARRRRIERFAIRGIAVVLVAMAIASSVAALMPGTETYDGTRLIGSSRAGGFGYVAAAAISCVLMALVWRWPRPRSLVFAGTLLWVAGVIAFVATFTSGDRRRNEVYTYVSHETARHVADVMMAFTVVAWFAVPIVAFVYGLICVAVDDHVRRKLPPAPEFPVARIL
jgi:uncharacterized membrane protein